MSSKLSYSIVDGLPRALCLPAAILNAGISPSMSEDPKQPNQPEARCKQVSAFVRRNHTPLSQIQPKMLIEMPFTCLTHLQVSISASAFIQNIFYLTKIYFASICYIDTL